MPNATEELNVKFYLILINLLLNAIAHVTSEQQSFRIYFYMPMYVAFCNLCCLLQFSSTASVEGVLSDSL